jgi:hypothetical protein
VTPYNDLANGDSSKRMETAATYFIPFFFYKDTLSPLIESKLSNYTIHRPNKRFKNK